MIGLTATAFYVRFLSYYKYNKKRLANAFFLPDGRGKAGPAGACSEINPGGAGNSPFTPRNKKINLKSKKYIYSQ
jgi:hypothetical protein